MTHTKDEALKLMVDALKASKHGHLDHKWADEAIIAGEQALAAPVQSCYCPNCEAMGKELAALKAQSHANDLTHDQWDAWQDKHGLILERDALDDLLSMLVAQPAPVPVEWMEMVAVNLLREGVNKHKARELAEHFYSFAPAAQPAPVQTVAIPDNVRKIAKAMQKDGYRGPLSWARTVIDFVATYKSPPAAQPAVPLTERDFASACLSYRHDFGLMDETNRGLLMFQAREWARAFGLIVTAAAPEKGQP